MLDQLRTEIRECKRLADELDVALTSTMFSSANHNKAINEARARMKICLEEMKK